MIYSANTVGRSGVPPSGLGKMTAMTVMTSAAQAPKRAVPPLQIATRAYLEGRYDEVDQITEKLDARDPNVAAISEHASDSARNRPMIRRRGAPIALRSAISRRRSSARSVSVP